MIKKRMWTVCLKGRTATKQSQQQKYIFSSFFLSFFPLFLFCLLCGNSCLWLFTHFCVSIIKLPNLFKSNFNPTLNTKLLCFVFACICDWFECALNFAANFNKKYYNYKRLSNETISSPYDDRLDKKEGGGLIGPPTSRSR